MDKFKFCSNCGFKMGIEDRYCSNCGNDTFAKKGESRMETPSEQTAKMQPGIKKSNTGIIIAVSVTVLLLLLGGVFAIFSTRKPKVNPPVASNPQQNEQQGEEQGDGSTEADKAETDKTPPAEEKPDFAKASTYLSKPGLKATFYVNYPDGTAGVVDRISSSIAPDPSVIVTEVETGVDIGEEYGFGSHYVEREDGTYIIYDSIPYEIMPVMKDGLYVGHTWDYSDEYGEIVWTVTEMGVDLDLGFRVFQDCVVVEEDNQAVGFQSLTYYAPGYGIVRVVDPSGGTEYYRMTALEEIGEEAAKQLVLKWAPNYSIIKDDRTQI